MKTSTRYMSIWSEGAGGLLHEMATLGPASRSYRANGIETVSARAPMGWRVLCGSGPGSVGLHSIAIRTSAPAAASRPYARLRASLSIVRIEVRDLYLCGC